MTMTTLRVTLDNPESVPAPYRDRFAHVARLDMAGGALLMLSGQCGVDVDGTVAEPGDITAQAERTFETVAGLLAAHGAGFDDVLQLRTFLTDLDDLPGYAAVRTKYFGARRPASTTVEVSRLFLDGLVLEVEITAAVAAV
jgi:enamine deaminase RidA (YjgF/YER057c/UK114 family)